MDDRLGPECCEGGLQEGHIGEIPLDEPAVEDSPGVARAQVIVDEDLMAQRPQRLDDMAANVAGASCDEDFILILYTAPPSELHRGKINRYLSLFIPYLFPIYWRYKKRTDSCPFCFIPLFIDKREGLVDFRSSSSFAGRPDR